MDLMQEKFLKLIRRVIAFVLIICITSLNVGPIQAKASETEYMIDDNYVSFETYLSERPAGASHVKLASNLTSIGNAVLSTEITALTGWQAGDIPGFEKEGVKERSIGNVTAGTVTFAGGCNTTVSYINFYKKTMGFDNEDGAAVVIENGADVVFENCKFSNRVTNNGTAVFKNCTFVTGDIMNNGSATYTDGTIEPDNLGQETEEHVELGLNVNPKAIKDAVSGTAYDNSITCELYGTNKADAVITYVLDSGSGLTAEFSNNTIKISGVPEKAGIYTLTITASYHAKNPEEDESDVKTLKIRVLDSLSAMLDNTLETGTKGKYYVNLMDVYVKEGDSEAIDFNEFLEKNPDAKITAEILPEGSGLEAEYSYNRLKVCGIPSKEGRYSVVATVRSGEQTAVSNSVDLRICEDNKSLAQLFDEVSGTAWDIEP